MLCQREVTDGVEVLSVRGPVTPGDAEAMGAQLTAALALQPRAVLIDLTATTEMAPAALAAIECARQAARGWPRPALVVCCDSKERESGMAQLGLTVHPDRADGISHADDRSAAPRRRLRLPHALSSPAQAREQAREVALALDCDEVSDDLSLVVSELVTNAVRYAEPPVELEIEVTADEVVIAVDDGTPGRPAPRDAPVHAEGGRGLTMVDLISAETGVRPNPPGKTVWASLRRGAPVEANRAAESPAREPLA